MRLGSSLKFINLSDFPFKQFPILDQNEVIKSHLSKDVVLEPESINFVDVTFRDKQLAVPIANLSNEIVRIDKEKSVGKFYDLNKINVIEKRSSQILEKEIYVDTEVTNDQKEELVKLLNEYRECVAKSIDELSCTREIKMDIQLKDPKINVSAKPYKLSSVDREDLNKIIDDYKRLGIVTETTSNYASPAFIVRKKDGTPRMVVDYRKLNDNTVKIHFPLPSFDESLEYFHDSTLFITLDLASGYLQIPLSPEASEKTAFITQDQTGQFQRVMFGLTNAPFYFAKLMRKILGRSSEKLAFNFFDDTCIFAKTWRELMDKLSKVLQLLKEGGLTLNLSKCKFGMREVEFLGFVIGRGKIRPSERKTEAIRNFPCPTNVREIQRFIGLASFFRRFVPRFAEIASPLTSLTKSKVDFVWGNEQRESFDKIKRMLTCEPVLKMYSPTAVRTELHTDASALGLGAMLLQSDDNGQMHLVYAISRKTSETEAIYHSSKLELLAIVWAIERLRTFLIGLHFTIITDCQALIYMNALKTKKPQIVRWFGVIADYDFEIKHRKGEQMAHVDALSRAPIDSNSGEEMRETVYAVETREDEILIFQRTDESVREKIAILQKSERMRTVREKALVENFVIENGILYKQHDEKSIIRKLFVVPKAMRKTIVIRFHDFKSHCGVDRTVAGIKQFYFFSRMRAYVRFHIKACIECILNKNKVGKQEGVLHPISPGKRPFETVNIDHLGPFITTPRRNQYVFAIIDNLTKFAVIYPVRNVTSKITVEKMEHFVNQFGAPIRIISDRGTSFTSGDFGDFIKKHGIKHVLNSSRHPQANGQVEKLNDSILAAVKVNLEHRNGKDWDLKLPKIQSDLNSTINMTTRKTPFEGVYGWVPRIEGGQLREVTSNNEIYRPPGEVQQEITANIVQAQDKNKERYDKNRLKNVKYKIGDIVFVKSNPISTGESTKLQLKFKGPMVITAVLPNDTYGITYLREQGRNRFSTTAHVSQLKIWRGNIEDLREEEKIDSELQDYPEESESIEINVNKESSTNDNTIDRIVENNNVGDDESSSEEPRDSRRSKRELRKPKYLKDYHC